MSGEINPFDYAEELRQWPALRYEMLNRVGQACALTVVLPGGRKVLIPLHVDEFEALLIVENIRRKERQPKATPPPVLHDEEPITTDAPSARKKLTGVKLE